MPYGFPASLLGTMVSGDIGPSTIYTDRFGKKVEFPKAPPKTPPSPGQARLRARFKESQANYMALSPADKSLWELMARRSSLRFTGQNLYIHFSMVHDWDVLVTISRQTGVAVTQPPAV